MSIEHITNHAALGEAQISERYRKPAIVALLRSWLTEVQELEGVFWALLTQRAVDNAEGAQLDVLGKLVDQPREGRVDDVYRAWVKSKIMVLRSSGLAEELIAIVKRLLPSVPIYLEEYPPLAMMMRADAAIDQTLGAQIAKFLSAAKGGGVALQFEWFAPALAQPFTLGAVSELNSPMGLDRGVLAAVSNGNYVEFYVPRPSIILAGLRIELDPNDVQQSGGLVTQFNNTNGVGGACAQAAAANQATLVAADPAFNGQPVVTFSGNDVATGKWYDLPSLGAAAQGEVFVVMKPDYSTPNNPPPGGTSGGRVGLWDLGTGAPTLYNYQNGAAHETFGTNVQKPVGVGPVDYPHIYNVRSAPGSHVAYRTPRGYLSKSSSNTVAFRNPPKFGRASTPTFFNGKLAYAAICDQVQTPEAREAMMQYLANRFGISAPLVAADILAGLVIELDPNDVVVNGSLVTQFNNTNGVGGACPQVTAANQATLVAAHASFAQQPVVAFSGNQLANAKWYEMPDLSALGSGEVFAVLSTDYSLEVQPPSTSYMGLWRIGSSTSATIYPSNSTGRIFDSVGSATRYDYGVVSPGLTNPHIYNVRVGGGTYEAWLSNAGIVTSVDGHVVSFSNAPRFGANAGATNCFNGKLAYLAICNQMQSPGARATMLAYLSARFGIALP